MSAFRKPESVSDRLQITSASGKSGCGRKGEKPAAEDGKDVVFNFFWLRSSILRGPYFRERENETKELI